MPHLDLLVPSSLVDAALAAELLRDVALPNLSLVLGRAGPPTIHELPVRSSLTPWQDWVFARRAGVESVLVNLGELWAMACGLVPAASGGRYVAEPAHFKVANDHLRLDDPRALGITLVEARALAAVIEPVLADAGWHLEPVEPATLTHWMLHRDDAAALSAPAIDRAIGDNVAEWQPRALGSRAETADHAHAADAALAWRRCINEIQMLWFGHEVNAAREADGRPPVNTLWLSGNGESRTALPRYVAVDSGIPLLAALPIEPGAERALETFDRFVEPARREDWSGWREQLQRLDLRLGGVLRQQAEGSIGTVSLVFCGRGSAREVTLGPRERASLWRRLRRSQEPSTASVFVEGAAS